MPTFVNFSSLEQDVRRYLERGGSAIADPIVFAQIPRLINAAERKLVQVLKLQGVQESLTDPTGFAINVSVIDKPDRWRETVSMFYGAGTDNATRVEVFPRSYEYCRNYWPNPTEVGPPEFYADYGYQHWLLVPTPEATYPVEILCYMQPPLLDDANQTNFFTDYTPNALLYGTLLEAEPFLKNDERIPTWKDFWTTELVTLGQQDLQKILDRGAERKMA